MLSSTPTRLFSIGDSLSDSGVIFRLTERLLIDPIALPVPGDLLDGPGYDGVFSDGPTHVMLLGEHFGAPLTGYAAGGARVDGQRPVGPQVEGGLPDGQATLFYDPAVPDAERAAILDYDLNVEAQVARLSALAPPTTVDAAPSVDPGATTLVTFFAGLNDFSDFASFAVDNPFAALLEAADFAARLSDGAQDAIADLASAAFVDQIAVYALPPLTLFPLPDDVSDVAVSFLDALIDTYNDELRKGAEETGAATEKEIVVVPTEELAAEIEADPLTFGFLDKGPYYLGGGTSPDFPDGTPEEIAADPQLSFQRNSEIDDGLSPEQLQFFDQLHFSSALHERLGIFAAESLLKEDRFLGDSDALELALGTPHLVFGQDGADRIFAGRSDDTVLAGRGADFVWGGFGADVISGGAGDDDLRGGTGADLLAGGPGDDILRGGFGADLIVGGPGEDTAFGGLGDDAFVWIAPGISGQAGGTGLYDGGAGHDLLCLVAEGGLADALIQAAEQRSPDDVAAGRYEFASIGLTATGIKEFIVLRPEELEAGADPLPEVHADLVGIAHDWGFI